MLAFVLGSLLEDSLRRSLLLFDGDPTGFLTRPISGTLLVLFLVVAVLPAIQAICVIAPPFAIRRAGGRRMSAPLAALESSKCTILA